MISSKNLKRRQGSSGEDERFMEYAIDLALKAEGKTAPNPIVGAVVVKNGKILGSGYHRKCGLPHAEINAIRSAASDLSGSTLYVTLEPCDHFGRTPPCTDAIISAGIQRVVVAMADPNPVNNGRGMRKLRRAGIRVKKGVLEKTARGINKPYIKYITKNIPFVTLKLAQSLDGKIASRTGDSKWITSGESRRLARRMRGRADAVMVGIGTVIQDDPGLLPDKTAKGCRMPLRIVVDSRLKMPAGAKMLSSVSRSGIMIATTASGKRKNAARLESLGARIIVVRSKNGRVDLRDLMVKLARMEVTHVLAEGGGELAADLLKEKLVDRCMFFIAPKIIGGRDAKTSVEGKGISKMAEALRLSDVRISSIGGDILIEGAPKYPTAQSTRN